MTLCVGASAARGHFCGSRNLRISPWDALGRTRALQSNGRFMLVANTVLRWQLESRTLCRMDSSAVVGSWFRVSGAAVVGLGLLMGACSSDGTKASMPGVGGSGMNSGAGGSGTTAASVMNLDGILG